jgi:PEGA domain
MSRPPLVFRPAPEPPPETGVSRGVTQPLSILAAPDANEPASPAVLSSIRTDAASRSVFEGDGEIPYKTQRRAPNGPGIFVVLLAVALVGVILGLTYLAVRRPSTLTAPFSSSRQSQQLAPSGQPPSQTVQTNTPVADTGQAQFVSRPSGAEVLIDGVARGKTPLKLSLPVGEHSLEIRGEAGSRTLPISIEAGLLVSQYVELNAAPTAATGRLDVTSDPVGAQVRVDGTMRGITPLTLDPIAVGDHNVALTRGSSTVYRSVKVSGGATVSVFAAMPVTPGAVGGFVAFEAPLELQVLEGGRLLGTTRAERLMVPTGRHEFELINAAAQFRTTVTVDVQAGRTLSHTVAAPNGSLSVNALPWAEVFIDGRSVGTTPLANLPVVIGSHEIVWRHPQLGERRRTIIVTAQEPVRVGQNFEP